MKKFAKLTALVLVLALALSLTAFAAGDDKPVITPEDGPVSFVTEGEYAYQMMNVNFTNAAIQDGRDYMIWVVAATTVEGETVYIPTQSSILYIGQGTASGTTFTFSGVFPKAMNDCAVMISGPGLMDIDTADGSQDGLYTLATIKMPYILGDADMNGMIDAVDALLILQYRAGIDGAELTSAGLQAADANADGYVDAVDALSILQYRAGLIDSLPPEGE